LLVQVQWRAHIQPFVLFAGAKINLTVTKEQEISSCDSTDRIVEGLALKAKVLFEHDEGVSKQKADTQTLHRETNE
jgi:hypothetical protein